MFGEAPAVGEIQWQGLAGRPPTRASRGGWGDPINLRHDADGHHRSGHFARVECDRIRADSAAAVRSAVLDPKQA